MFPVVQVERNMTTIKAAAEMIKIISAKNKRNPQR
jgi:hypothetical protein